MNPAIMEAAEGDVNLTLIFAIGIFAWLIIKEMLKFVVKQNERKKLAPESEAKEETREKIEKLVRMIDDLHKWHSKTDEDGVPVWYMRRSFEAAINKLADNIEKQTIVFTKLIEKIENKIER